MNEFMDNEAKCILTGRDSDTPESRSRWYRSLSEEERMDLMCEFYDLIVENQPDIARRKRASQAQGPVQILRIEFRREDLIASKKAAGRPIDLEDVRQLEN